MAISKQIYVGLLAIVSCIILYVGFYFLKGSSLFSPTKKYVVFYDQIDGLTISNQVLIKGFSVGRVSQIDLSGNNNRIKVELEVSNKIYLGLGTSALLTDDGMLGGKIIELQPTGFNPSDASTFMQSGDTLQSLVKKSLTTLLTEKAEPVIHNIDSTIIHLNRMMSEYDGMSQKVSSILENLDKTTGNLNGLLSENRTKISSITGKTDQMMGSLQQSQAKIDGILQRMESVSKDLDEVEMKAMSDDLRKSLAEMQTILKAINESQGTLGKLVHDDSLYVNLNSVVVHLDSIMLGFQANPKTYIPNISVFGKKDKKEKK